jgi:hypothetical protein
LGIRRVNDEKTGKIKQFIVIIIYNTRNFNSILLLDIVYNTLAFSCHLFHTIKHFSKSTPIQDIFLSFGTSHSFDIQNVNYISFFSDRLDSDTICLPITRNFKSRASVQLYSSLVKFLHTDSNSSEDLAVLYIISRQSLFHLRKVRVSSSPWKTKSWNK